MLKEWKKEKLCKKKIEIIYRDFELANNKITIVQDKNNLIYNSKNWM